MGVIYDFNQQVIPTDNDYDVVKVVPTGFVLYRENMPSFAFFPGQFVGVRNGIKVNDPQSNWKLLEIDSYFAQFGNQKEVIENLPEEFKEVLRKFLLQAAKTSIDTQKDDVFKDEATDALEEAKEKPNIYKILDKFNSERKRVSYLTDILDIFRNTADDPEKLAFTVFPLVVIGFDAVSSPDLYSHREEVSEMTLEEFVKMLKTTGLSSVQELIKDIIDTKGESSVPDTLIQAKEFITSINRFPILEFLKEQLSAEEYKAIVSLKVKDFISAFLHGISDEEKNVLKEALSKKYVELASTYLSIYQTSSNRLDRFIDLLINYVYLNLVDTGGIGKKFIEDEDNGINLLFALADLAKHVFKEISSTQNFLVHFKEYAISDSEVIDLEKQVKKGSFTNEMLLNELLSFIRELENIKKNLFQTDKLVKLSEKMGVFFAKVVILTEGQLSKLPELVEKAQNYISGAQVELGEFDKLEALIEKNFLKIYFNRNLKKFFKGFSEQEQKTGEDERKLSFIDSDLDVLSLKDIEQMFVEAVKEHLSKLYDLVDLENLDTNLEQFILQKDFSSATKTNVTIRNTEVPGYLALFVASIDPRLFNSISGKDNLKKHQFFKEFLKKLEIVGAHSLSEEEESLYIRSLSLVAKDFTEISEDEINSFINSVNAYIQDEKTLNNAISIINNVFKVASFIFGRGEQYFKRPQLGILALHDKIIESLEIEKILKLSDPSLTENYIFNFRQQLRLLNQRGVNHIRRDRGTINVLMDYVYSVQEVAKSLHSISPDIYEGFIKTFIREFSLYGDYAFLNGIEKINQSLSYIFKKLKDDILYTKSSLDLDVLQKIFKSISLGEILRAETIIPFKHRKIYEPISAHLLERESPGTFFTIARVQHNLNSLLSDVRSIFDYIKIIRPNNTDILQQLLTFPDVIKRNLSPLSYLKLNVSLPSSSDSDTFFGEVYFCDNNVVRDPKIFPKVFTNHGTQSLYYSILNPDKSQMSRQDVFYSLNVQWENFRYVPLLQSRYEEEIYGNRGVRRSKINLSSVDSIFEQDNILNQANIQNISVSTTSSSSNEFYSKELKTINIKYELGEEEIYFTIPIGVQTAYSGFMEYLFNSAYLSKDVSEDTLAKMYLVLSTLKLVREKADGEALQTLLAGDKMVDETIKILQELQASPSGKKILDKAFYRYMSLAGGFSYGKKGRQERALVDVGDEGDTNEVLAFLFSKPIQDLGRKTSNAFLDILYRVPDVFRSLLSLSSVVRVLYAPPNFQHSTFLGFTTDKPFLFSRRGTFLDRVSHENNRTSPITLVSGLWGNINLFYDILQASNDTFFDYDLFSRGGKSEIQIISGNEKKEVFFANSKKNMPYSSYHGYSSSITTAVHEIGHTIYYELPFQTKKRMFEFYSQKYIKGVSTTLDKFLDKLPESTKNLVKTSLLEARLIALEILESDIEEKKFKELLRKLQDSLKSTTREVYVGLAESSNLQEEFKLFVKEIREKYIAPYVLSSFYELSSVAFDAYMYDREEFARNFPEEYKYVIIPMLEYLYNKKGIDLTVEGLWGEKVQDADYGRMLT